MSGGGIFWRVQIGECKTLGAAKRKAGELKKYDYSGYIMHNGKFYTVSTGIFEHKENAEKLKNRLIDYGFKKSIVRVYKIGG